MKDDFYKDIKHKRTQSDAKQPKGKNKEKKDKVKEENKEREEQSLKRSAKYKEQQNDAAGQFPGKVKAYFNRENMEKGKAFFAGKLSSYNERFSNELKVTKEKLNEFRNRPKTGKDTAHDPADESGESGRNKGLVPMIVGGVIIVPITLILGFVIISNFWPSNDGMQLATDEGETEEVAEEEEINEELDEQRFEMERRMAESRDSEEDDSGNEEEDASEDGEDVVEEGGDLASENIDSIYSDEEVSILEDIAEVAIDEKGSGDDAGSEEEEESGSEDELTEDEEAAEDETESAGATHVVGEDDNLFQIARQYYGDGSSENVQRIRDANGISGNNISVGQELIIP